MRSLKRTSRIKKLMNVISFMEDRVTMASQMKCPIAMSVNEAQDILTVLDEYRSLLEETRSKKIIISE